MYKNDKRSCNACKKVFFIKYADLWRFRSGHFSRFVTGERELTTAKEQRHQINILAAQQVGVIIQNGPVKRRKNVVARRRKTSRVREISQHACSKAKVEHREVHFLQLFIDSL